MPGQNKALASYRRRLRQQGVARIEVKVRKEDAPLVRDVVRALADPQRENEARQVLREHFGPAKPEGLVGPYLDRLPEGFGPPDGLVPPSP